MQETDTDSNSCFVKVLRFKYDADLQWSRGRKFKPKDPLNNAWTDWVYLDPDRVDLIVQHKLRGMDYYELIQEAGDCIFIPYAMLHQVQKLDEGMQVAASWMFLPESIYEELSHSPALESVVVALCSILFSSTLVAFRLLDYMQQYLFLELRGHSQYFYFERLHLLSNLCLFSSSKCLFHDLIPNQLFSVTSFTCQPDFEGLFSIQSFKVGRVGDDELFGKLRVNVSPTFECSSQTGETPLEEQCHCWYLKLNFFSSVSVAMASDDAQVRRAVEQTKLERWCAAHHIESTSDLAFYFVTYEEALLEGRAVADAWEQARREVEIGAGALVRDLFRREQVSQAAPRPTTSPTLMPRPTPSFAGPVRPSAQGHQSGGPAGGALVILPQLMATLLAIEPPPAARLADHRQLRGEAQECSPEGGSCDREACAPHVARAARGYCSSWRGAS